MATSPSRSFSSINPCRQCPGAASLSVAPERVRVRATSSSALDIVRKALSQHKRPPQHVLAHLSRMDCFRGGEQFEFALICRFRCPGVATLLRVPSIGRAHGIVPHRAHCRARDTRNRLVRMLLGERHVRNATTFATAPKLQINANDKNPRTNLNPVKLQSW